MELHAKNRNQKKTSTTPDPKLGLDEDPNYGKTLDTHDSQHLFEDFDSSCSTPYVSAPSSPGRAPVKGGGFFYSCPASPMHFAAVTTTAAALSSQSSSDNNEFEFSARSGSTGSGQSGSMTTMSSADELFLNGKIRPMKLSTHLERPQVLAPLLDFENEDEEGDDHCYRGSDLRLRDNKSLRRRTRSISPLRSSTLFEFNREELENAADSQSLSNINGESVKIEEETTTTTTSSSTPSVSSASSSRSSSAGRNSKRWVFLKDFLYRSKSEGRSPNNKFWPNISFSSSAKDKKSINNTIIATASSVQVEEAEADSKDKGNGNVSRATVAVGNNTQKVKVSGQGSGKRTVNGVGKSRRVIVSPHELHYKASRAQAEEMRKKTFLPYRQGLLGCLSFSSKGYGAMNGFARALNPVSSR